MGKNQLRSCLSGYPALANPRLPTPLKEDCLIWGESALFLTAKAMRLGISRDLSHDAAGRAENLRRSSYIAKYLNDSGLICCAAFVAPNADSREHMIDVIGEEKLHRGLLEPAFGSLQTARP